MNDLSYLKGKMIILNDEYPIYGRTEENENDVIGYTSLGDMAVITYVDEYKGKYFEVTIVSGKYSGVDSIALSMKNIETLTFVINKIDDGSIGDYDHIVLYNE